MCAHAANLVSLCRQDKLRTLRLAQGVDKTETNACHANKQTHLPVTGFASPCWRLLWSPQSDGPVCSKLEVDPRWVRV